MSPSGRHLIIFFWMLVGNLKNELLILDITEDTVITFRKCQRENNITLARKYFAMHKTVDTGFYF